MSSMKLYNLGYRHALNTEERCYDDNWTEMEWGDYNEGYNDGLTALGERFSKRRRNDDYDLFSLEW